MNPEKVSPEEMSPLAEGNALLRLPQEREPVAAGPAFLIVRPLVYQRHERLASASAGIAAAFPTRVPESPILGQAALRDLAWLCAYLREVAEDMADFEPVRKAVLDFLYENAPEQAPEWLEVRVPDEPLRWGFRVRISRDLGDKMSRLMRMAVAAGELLSLDQGGPYTFPCACITTMAEIELAMCDVPVWKPQLRKVHELAAQTLDLEVSQ